MLELMKELGFIPESRVVKLYRLDDKVVGERYDKVTYLREVLPDLDLTVEEPVYVESGRFLPLIPFIQRAVACDNYLQVILRNGAEYKFPYIEIEFSRPEVPDIAPSIEIEGEIDLSILKKTALQNLVKPEMRCIYVDRNGAVSCNFLQGTVDTGLKSQNPILLPPDLIDYMQSGEKGMICTIGDLLFYTNRSTKWIWAPKSELEQAEDGEVPWYESIYNQSRAAVELPHLFSDIPAGIEDSLKRLQFFGTEAVFYADKIMAGENFEPVAIPSAIGGVYTLEEVVSVIPFARQIAFFDNAMYLRNGDVTILVSEKEEE